MNPEEFKKLSEDLKEVIPYLMEAKDLLGQIPVIGEQLKDVQEQIKNMDGTVLELGKKVVEIGKRKVVVQSSGMDDETKLDFAKFFVNMYKFSKDAGRTDCREVVIGIQKKYATKGMTEGTDADGGYGVPEAFSNVIWRVAEQASVALRDCLITPLTPGYKMPLLNLASAVSVTWVDEAGPSIESNPTFGKTTVSAKKMLAHSLMSNELLEDEEIGLVDLIITLFGEAMAVEIDSQAFTGTGSPFTGALKASGVNSVVMAGTNFNTVDFDDCSDALSKLKESVRAGAKWYMNRTIINFFRKLKDSENGYVWGPPADGNPATIWGVPIQEVEACPASTDTALNTPFILYGNMKNYQIGTKGDMTVRIASELKILNDQTVLVVRRRIAMATALAAAFVVIKTAASS